MSRPVPAASIVGELNNSDWLAQDNSRMFFYYDIFELANPTDGNITVNLSLAADPLLKPFLAYWTNFVLPDSDWGLPADLYQTSIGVQSNDSGATVSLAAFSISPGAAYQLAVATRDYVEQGSQLDGYTLVLNGPGVTVTPSSRGDFDGDGTLDETDIDSLGNAIRDDGYSIQFDLNRDGAIDVHDAQEWLTDQARTYYGDSNLDGEFNSNDLVTVFEAGQYEDHAVLNSTWATGDWNGDGDFTTSDLVRAFVDGGYELGPRATTNAVPEPAGITILSIALAAFSFIRHPFR